MDARALKALSLGLLAGAAALLLGLALAGVGFRLPVLAPPASPDSASADRPPAPIGSEVRRGEHATAPPGMAPSLSGPSGSRLRQAQDRSLEALVASRKDRKAMRNLVAIRKRLAGGDPKVLRLQAAAYRQAAARGQTLEQYMPAALSLLAEATELAAAESEKEQRAVRTAPPAGTPKADVVRAAVRPAAPDATARTSRRVRPAVINGGEISRYRIQVGPIRLLQRAATVGRELTALGLKPTLVRGREPRLFRVVSGPLQAAAAERRMVALEAVGLRPRLRPLASGRALIDFGMFPALAAADVAASEIRRKGFPAAVVPVGGIGHLITLGPYPRAGAQDVIERIRSRFGPALPIVLQAQRPPD